jgi:hypothetical protein
MSGGHTSDAELAEALAFEMGEGGSCGPDSLGIEFNGAGLRIWASWEVQNIHSAKPVYSGKATIAKARKVYGIRDPAERQMSLF